MADKEEMRIPEPTVPSQEVPLKDEDEARTDDKLSPEEQKKRQEYVEEFEKYIFICLI